MSIQTPHNITGPELATTLKQLDYPVKYPKWAVSESIPEAATQTGNRTSAADPPGVRTRPLPLQTLASIHIVAYSDPKALRR